MDLLDNCVIKFKNISKTKNGIFANFKVKGERGGTTFSASISVELDSAEVSLGDSLELIIERCAQVGVAEFKRSEFQFEGITCI